MSGKSALFDSNVFIYLSQNKLDNSKILSLYDRFHTSVITKMEVFGYALLSRAETSILTELFDIMLLENIDNEIIDKVIEIRKNKRVKLPDAIIYATASVRKLALVTRNIDDFVNIDNSVELVNPFEV